MNLKTTKCECGHEFTARDINPPFTSPPIGFYGGRVKRFCAAECKCGRTYKLYVNPEGHSWSVLDMERTDTNNIEQVEPFVDEVEPTEPFVDDEPIEPKETLECKYCGKVCASRSGLNSHERHCKKK